MSKCDDLLELAKRNPRGLRFTEVCQLAECWGFRHRKSRGGTSHRVYKRDGTMRMLNFQSDNNGMAKRRQVEQLLDAIDELTQKGIGP